MRSPRSPEDAARAKATRLERERVRVRARRQRWNIFGGFDLGSGPSYVGHALMYHNVEADLLRCVAEKVTSAADKEWEQVTRLTSAGLITQLEVQDRLAVLLGTVKLPTTAQEVLARIEAGIESAPRPLLDKLKHEFDQSKQQFVSAGYTIPYDTGAEKIIHQPSWPLTRRGKR